LSLTHSHKAKRPREGKSTQEKKDKVPNAVCCVRKQRQLPLNASSRIQRIAEERLEFRIRVSRPDRRRRSEKIEIRTGRPSVRAVDDEVVYFCMKHGLLAAAVSVGTDNRSPLRERHRLAGRLAPDCCIDTLAPGSMGHKGRPKKRHLAKKRAKDCPRILSAVPSSQTPRYFHQFSEHSSSHVAVLQPRT
jgi:hypothetical protein